MYKDELWHRKLVEAIDQSRGALTDKQWARCRMGDLLRVANRVREFSGTCETCRQFQRLLSQLERELQELPKSKAQRQYQARQLLGMEMHMAKVHHVAPPGFYVKTSMRMGALLGTAAGCLASLPAGYLLLIPAGSLAGLAVAALYGTIEDQRVERDHRHI